VNAIEQAKQAYAPTQFPLKSSRAIEAQLFARTTSRLQRAAETEADFGILVKAIHENREMWITLAVDLANEDNQLPENLRAQLFSLAAFTASHSQKALKREASVDILVEINMAVLRGLNVMEPR
jgi:flagellar protein FlaF